MFIVGWDTGGEQGSVGLLRDGCPWSEIAFLAALKQGEKLLPALDAALQLAGAKRSDVGLISVSTGPGSFTGLRIGIAMAKGLTRALEIPIVGVQALDAYVRAASFWEGPVWVLLSDRRDWVYAASYRGGQLWTPVQAISLDSLFQSLAKSEGALFIGPGAEQHREQLTERFERSVVAPTALNRPSGIQIAQLGLEKYLHASRDEFYELEPFYLTSPPPPLRIGEGRPKAGVR